MQTAFTISTPVAGVRVGDGVWLIGGRGYAVVERVEQRPEGGWLVQFKGVEPVDLDDGDTLQVRHEVE